MATKILLIEDVEHVGRKGDLAVVKPGHAFNYLIPQGFALIADKAAMRRQALLQQERKLRAEQERKEAEEMATRLHGEMIETEVKVDHEGHMYGSVSALDIIHLLKLKTGIELEKKMIQLKHPIKEVGIYDLELRLKESITAMIHLQIMPEQE